MTQMVLLSTLMHLLFFGVLSVIPFFKQKKVTYAPVYTVNLINLPSTRKTIKPSVKTKPVDLLSGKKKSAALAKLKTLEKKMKTEKTLEKNSKMEESDIPEMMAALNKIAEVENENLLIGIDEKKDKLLEDLDKLEEEWSKDKDNEPDFEKSESLKRLEELEKKWQEEDAKLQVLTDTGKSGMDEALARLTGSVTSLSNQNITETPSYLSIYFSFITNKAMSQWKNPSGVEILTEKETNKKTIVSFNIIRSGGIEDYEIHESSGNRMLDDLALKAIKDSDPFPPLPSEYHEDFLRVFLHFNYTLK